MSCEPPPARTGYGATDGKALGEHSAVTTEQHKWDGHPPTDWGSRAKLWIGASVLTLCCAGRPGRFVLMIG